MKDFTYKELLKMEKDKLDDMLQSVAVQMALIRCALVTLSEDDEEEETEVADGDISSMLDFAQWPIEASEYHYDDVPVKNRDSVYSADYLSLLSFLEDCVYQGAVAYHRSRIGFTWAVIDEKKYARICWEHGYSVKNFRLVS